MGKSSAFKPPNVVALECVPNDIGTNDVIYQLGSYGKITDVQFWTSNNGKKHGFVTFQDPEGARNCLGHAHNLLPVLSVKPVNQNTVSKYKTPPGSPMFNALNSDPVDESPSLISRLSTQPSTPTHKPNLQLKQDPASTQGVGFGSIPQGPPLSTRLDLPPILNGTHEPSWRIFNPAQNTPSSMPNFLGARLPLSEASAAARLPNSLPIASHNSPDPTLLSEENKRQEAEIARLKDEVHELQATIRNIKNGRASDLDEATARAERYKAERDKLHYKLRDSEKSVARYKTQHEDLRKLLSREHIIAQNNEGALRHDLRTTSKELADLKRKFEVQTRTLSLRATELSQSQQKLRAMGGTLRVTRFSPNKLGTGSGIVHDRSGAELEGGQANDIRIAQPLSFSPPKSSPLSPTGRQMVLPALEKAFDHLDQLTTSALLEIESAKRRDSDAPNKRPRRA